MNSRTLRYLGVLFAFFLVALQLAESWEGHRLCMSQNREEVVETTKARAKLPFGPIPTAKLVHIFKLSFVVFLPNELVETTPPFIRPTLLNGYSSTNLSPPAA